MSATKYIFVTGGVTSSLGKGIISASLAKLLQARGYSVTIQKLDPYINIDPGTLNPYEHGECFVTDDGAETDLVADIRNIGCLCISYKIKINLSANKQRIKTKKLSRKKIQCLKDNLIIDRDGQK